MARYNTISGYKESKQKRITKFIYIPCSLDLHKARYHTSIGYKESKQKRITEFTRLYTLQFGPIWQDTILALDTKD